MAEISIHLASPGDDGSVIVTLQNGSHRGEHRVEAAALQAVRRGVAQLMEKFESRRRPLADPVELADLRRLLRDTFLAPIDGAFPAWDGDGPGHLLFTSSDPECLNLPWELIRGADGQFLVAKARCTSIPLLSSAVI